MEITHLIKRDYTKESFQLYKITQAVLKAMRAVEHGAISDVMQFENSSLEMRDLPLGRESVFINRPLKIVRKVLNEAKKRS